MTHLNPADAVREALPEMLASAMETEASLLVSIVGRSVSASDVTLLRQGAAVIREQASRLAALAGAESRESRMVVVSRDASGTPTVWCDPEIAGIVQALNDGGVPTVASCSGHGHRPGWIALSDGRVLVIAEDLEQAQRIGALFPTDINGAPAVSNSCDEIDTSARSVDALAGAAPDWVMVPREKLKELRWKCEKLRRDGHRCDFRVTTEAISESIGAMLAAPHAPAKAREVTDADVRRSAVAYDAVTSRMDDPCSFTGMRAALATFAEGE